MLQKRIAAIHDISCLGKCSLTVALPIISASGIETAVIPTAVLSTHTGGFSDFTFRDLTNDILPVANHWKKENIKVDGIYTGYLGSKEQICIVKEAISIIKNDNAIIIVDPVMADNGKLYNGFKSDFPIEMKKLCAIADIITPNITEACFLLEKEYKAGPYSKNYIEDLLIGLSKITKGKIVLTGVWFNDSEIGVATYENGNISYVFSNRIDDTFHGTGDVFTSTLVCGILNDKTLNESANIACKFTAGCIKRTKENHPEMKYGVNFEAEIPNLIKYLGL